jgi:NADH:ubiquinone oxidoreductase subunit 3 (subunit A)
VVGAAAAVPGAAAVPRGIDAAVAAGLVESRHMVFLAVMVFLALVALGFLYDWRKGFFQWR